MASVPRKRAAMLLVMLLSGLVALGGRLAYVQGLRSQDYSALAKAQRVRKIVLPATRGAVYDRSGRELALSIPARTIYANPKQIHDPDGTARVLAPLLDLPIPELVSKLTRSTGFVYLKRRVDADKAQRVESLRLIGIGAIDEARRVYPSGQLAAGVLGFVGTDPAGATGLAGLEHGYESLLRGRAGLRVLEQDPHGRAIPQGEFREEPPVEGADLVLTIDRDIQYAAEQALDKAVKERGAKGGTIVVLDPRTGDVLAMASDPTFDPNDVHDLKLETTRNRAVTDAYEPGSANKVVTAAAALEEGIVSPTSAFHVPAALKVAGTIFHDAHGHGVQNMTFTDIIAKSSNVGTIQVALKLGPDRLWEYLTKFGYGKPTNLGFPGENGGILPRADRWKTSLPTMAIGQGLSVTALQIVRVLGIVGNGGIAVEPRMVSGWVDRRGQLHAAPSSRSSRIISEQTATTLRGILGHVVTDGTGEAAAVPGYTVAGKTGTAQKPGPHGGYQGYMASFIGLVPAEAPALAIGVVLEDPTPIWGGVSAAPVFREVAQAALRIMRVPPTGPEQIVKASPDVAADEGPALQSPVPATPAAPKPVVPGARVGASSKRAGPPA